MRILLVRHPETTWNKERRIQGRKDSPMTQLAWAQLDNIFKQIKQNNIDYLFTSPLDRCKKSAEYLAKQLGCPVKTDERLIQKSWGVVEGMKRQEVAVLYPESGYGLDGTIVDLEKRYYFKPTDGEGWEDLEKRVNLFIDYLKENHNPDTILVVGHRPIIRLLIGQLLGLDPKKANTLEVEAEKISCIEVDEKAKLITFNNKHFFKRMKFGYRAH